MEMLTASLAALCALLVLVLLIQRPKIWPLLLILMILWGIWVAVFRYRLRNWVVRWIRGRNFEKSKAKFSLEQLSQPAALLSGETVLWYNAEFCARILGGAEVLVSRVQKVLPGLDLQQCRTPAGQLLTLADGFWSVHSSTVPGGAECMTLLVLNEETALRRIEAKDVDIRFTIRDGRIATQPFDLSVGGISLNLSGSTGLDQTIDYTARVTLPEVSAGGILTAVDVGIGGSFSSPKITLDVKNAVKDAVSNAIGEKLGLSVGSSEGKSADEIRADAKAKGDKLVEGRRRANWPGSRRRPAATRWCRPPRSRRRNSWSRPSSRSPRSNSSRRSMLGEGRFRIRKRPSRVGISGFRNDSRR